MSKRRATIARRLVEAQSTAAMLSTFNEVDMTAVMALRERHKQAFKDKHGVGLGIASFFVKASIGALRAFPRLNAEIQGDEMVLKHYYDIGVAVGASEGLVVPVLRDADRMWFAAIEKQIRDFAKRAEDGTLSLADLKGGTFTITNGGVFGSLLSTPILNPPQVGILGLHKIQDRPVAIDRQVQVRPMMYVALTYDHRIVDGAEAVRFLVRREGAGRGSRRAAARVASDRRRRQGRNVVAETEIDRIVDELEREHGGDAWHGTPLRQILAGVGHTDAMARPYDGVQTIWELVLHITAWKNEVRRRVGGAPAGAPAEGDWPAPPATPDAELWRAAVDALEDAHRALVATVSRLGEAQVFAPTNDPRERETGQGVSYYVLLHGIAQHDAYHSGQIALLKKALTHQRS